MYDIFVACRRDSESYFDVFKEENPHAVWLPGMPNVWEAMRKASRMALTEMYWLVTDDLFATTNNGIDFAWKPPAFDRMYPHRWIANETDGTPVDHFHGLYLMPRGYQPDESEESVGILRMLKEMHDLGIVANQFDVFFSATDAGYADHRFSMLKEWAPNAVLLDDADGLIGAVVEAKKTTFTGMFWLLTDEFFEADTTGVDLSWKPVDFDRQYPHRFLARSKAGDQINTFRGLHLIPRSYEVTDEEFRLDSLTMAKDSDRFGIVTKQFDLFFISYDEKYADRNYGLLKNRFPGAKHVRGIKGIAAAHRRCAELSDTSMFWTVDADTVVDQDFDFSFRPFFYDRKYLHVWHTRNPVNGLEYGWGAIKLWPRELVMSHDGNYLDYTTSHGMLKIVGDVVATSSFNSDPFRSWRSGFREAVKLAKNVRRGDDFESLDRLHAWCTVSKRVPHATDAVDGANDGLWYYLNGRGMLVNINDFDWLRTVYIGKDEHIKRDWDHKSLSREDLAGMIGSTANDQ